MALAAMAHLALLLFLTRDADERSQLPQLRRENVFTVELGPMANPVDAVNQASDLSVQSQADAARQSAAEAPDEAHSEPRNEPVAPPARPLPRYYRTSELSSAPIVLQDVLESQPMQITADKPKAVILTLLINEKGEIDQVLVENSELSIDTTRMLAEKFSRMKFEPGKIDGAPVRSQVKIAIDAGPLP